MFHFTKLSHADARISSFGSCDNVNNSTEKMEQDRLLLVQLAAAGIGEAHVVNNDGRSPLHIAAINNNVEMCKILIDHGAEINCIMRTARGQLITPLDVALRRGNRGCAKFLQLHGGLAAAKLTDSQALQRALSQAYTEN